MAANGSMAELEKLADRREAAALPDAEQQHERVRRGRFLRHSRDHLGGFRAELSTTPEEGARLLAGLRPWFRHLARAARVAGEDEPVEALMADALVQACTTNVPPSGAGKAAPADAAAAPQSATEPAAPATPGPAGQSRDRGRYRDCKVIVRVDHDALLRGHTHPGETCEVAGTGPVAVSVVRDMINCEAFVAAVVTRATDIVGVTHLGRRPTRLQATALQWRDPQCCVQGCPAEGYLETDHRTGWAVTGQTKVGDLDPFCSHHHSLKTNRGYRLDPGTGKRAMRPPPPTDEPP